MLVADPTLLENRRPSSASRVLPMLRYLSLAATALLSAVGEYHLARAVGIPASVAWALPAGLDAYAWSAFITGNGRDVKIALGLMIACQSAAHVLAADHHSPAITALTIAVSAVAPVVSWRVHQHAATATRAVVPVVADVVAQPAAASPVVPEAAAAPVPVTAEASGSVPVVVEVRAKRSKRQTAALVREYRSANPAATQAQTAFALGISEKWVRECLKLPTVATAG